jgi:hypothetical protein
LHDLGAPVGAKRHCSRTADATREPAIHAGRAEKPVALCLPQAATAAAIDVGIDPAWARLGDSLLQELAVSGKGIRAMLRSASRILGYRLNAQDGEVGRCVDFLLEQPTWTVRYVCVDAGARREGRPVWVSPLGLRKLEWTSRRWVLDGTRAQLQTEPASEPSLQSLKQLIGFGLDDADGNVGHIEDLIVDDDTWQCRYLVLNGEIRLSGRKTLVPTEWLGRVFADEHRIEAPVPRSRIENEPEYRPEAPMYHLHAPANDHEPLSARDRSVAPSWRFHPPLAWSQALQWGSRALGAALARTTLGRQSGGGI